ncbi:hypothetical protein BpJC7_11220 [Weizmannia acidilactici]|uniref:DUF3870 domain-containing protein n=1 Tax=Weizmannia acidilactici TaxID=2607726 RepID=A0A5J4JEI3_9BACI|nr:DUF3870 domain-containing protein [Weizmannia acidilactici]GER67597.1 hypothetical protein BpJC4_20680 [Weizmannia acidilactici]GER69819.1 hypothetical protein BpJC7_11220 [Weizmannia acidilactici]GER73683.1 hypothetical protein BpPP18_17500 [Weizmannia acidilactici]
MQTAFIAGHAKLPSGMAAKSIYETLTITAEIEMKYGVILDVSCTLATEHGRRFISNLLRGYSLNDGIEEPLKQLQEFYLGKASNALISAFKDLYKQYHIMLKSKRGE